MIARTMKIRTLHSDDSAAIDVAARILTAAFADRQAAPWATYADAFAEVLDALAPGTICRAAFDAESDMLGWIAVAPSYGGNVWELHPLAVRPDAQRRGVGRALVEDVERRVAERGGVTILLGADDEEGMTTLGNVDLYPNVCEHIAHVQNLRSHPFEFYRKCGFVIVGVVPDANGLGKPDILMAKRVSRMQPNDL